MTVSLLEGIMLSKKVLEGAINLASEGFFLLSRRLFIVVPDSVV